MAEGFTSLNATLNALGNIGNKISNNVLKESANTVLDRQKKDAARSSDGDNGADKLAIDKITSYKGNKSIKIGITKENWEDCKGLYFQNYGYELWKNGKRYEPHLGWVNNSFDKIKDKVAEEMKSKIQSEIDNILK